MYLVDSYRTELILLMIAQHGWYWGPLSGEGAERILAKEPDGSFVVR